MKYQPSRSHHLQVTDDRVYTPPALAAAIVAHFGPTGVVVEACEGAGEEGKSFTRALRAAPGVSQVLTFNREERGEDFLGDWGDPFLPDNELPQWVVTNPPWSQFSAFLEQGMNVAPNVVYLITLNHFFATKRRRLARQRGFGIVELLELDWPPTFPKMGFQLGVAHLRYGYQGNPTLTNWTGDRAPAAVKAEYAALAERIKTEQRERRADLAAVRRAARAR